MYIFRRLILGIPALIIISSTVFFLSKLMPGSSGASLLEQEEFLKGSTSTETREQIYRQYLERTGQDKPVFYFSIASLSEPDTLYKILPENRREFLQQLCLKYGQWSHISLYYNSILDLQKRVRSYSENIDKDLMLLQLSEQLFTATSEDEISQLLHQIEHFASTHVYNREVEDSFLNVKNRFQQVLLHQNKLKKFLPVVIWHGAENQYHAWLTGLLLGDFGVSLRGNRPVLQLIGEALSITLVMTIFSLLLAWVISLVISLLINLQSFSRLEKPVLNILYFIDTIPLFLLAFLLLLVLTGKDFFQFLPTFGLGDFRQEERPFVRIFILLNHLVLPVFCLTLVLLPYLIGQIDRALKEVAGKVYITTARAKGLAEHLVLTKHILNNAWSPLITIFTDNLPGLFSGALVVEVIFAVPGMGRLLADAVNARDYPVILGIVVIIATVRILSNIVADILYALADPRVKLTKGEINV